MPCGDLETTEAFAETYSRSKGPWGLTPFRLACVSEPASLLVINFVSGAHHVYHGRLAILWVTS